MSGEPRSHAPKSPLAAARAWELLAADADWSAAEEAFLRTFAAAPRVPDKWIDHLAHLSARERTLRRIVAA